MRYTSVVAALVAPTDGAARAASAKRFTSIPGSIG